MNTINTKAIIEQILYAKFTHYDTLSKQIGFVLSSKTIKGMNIYIDLYQFYISIFRYARYLHNTCLAECAINLAIHYKAFFRKYGVEANVILVQTPTISQNNRQFIPDYNKKYTDRIKTNAVMYELLKYNLEIMKTLIPYLPGIYIKYGTVEASVMIDHMIKYDFDKDATNLIVSLSPTMTQVVVNNPNTYGLINKNSYITGDTSEVYDYYTAMYEYFLENGHKCDFEIPDGKYHYISLMMSLFGLKRRDVPKMISAVHASKIINAIPPNIYGDTAMMYGAIQEVMSRYKSFINSNNSYDIFDNRFKCLDLRYQALMYNTMPESKEQNYLVDLKDKHALLEINNVYFHDNPLNLENI